MGEGWGFTARGLVLYREVELVGPVGVGPKAGGRLAGKELGEAGRLMVGGVGWEEVEVGEEAGVLVGVEPGAEASQEGFGGEGLAVCHGECAVVGVVEVCADADGRGGARVGAEEGGGAEAGLLKGRREGEAGRGVRSGAVEDAVGVGVLGGEEGDGGGGGEGNLAEVVVEDEGVRGEAVDVGCGVSGVAVAAEVVGAGGIDYEDDEVGARDGAPEGGDGLAVRGEGGAGVGLTAAAEDPEGQGEEDREQEIPEAVVRVSHGVLSEAGTVRGPKAAMASFMRAGMSMPAGQRATHSPHSAQASAGMPREW